MLYSKQQKAIATALLLLLHAAIDCLALAPTDFSPRLLVVIPGFGLPNLEEKLQILRNNIDTVSEHQAPWSQVVFRVFCYGDEESIPDDVRGDVSPLLRVEWIFSSGIIMEYLQKHATPEFAAEFDYVIIVLDDVEIRFNAEWLHWKSMLKIQATTGMDVLSCCLLERSMTGWFSMVHVEGMPELAMRQQVQCEMFCYFMTYHAYSVFYNFIDRGNPWSWGMDLLLTPQMKLDCGVVNDFVGLHRFHGYGRGEAFGHMTTYLANYGEDYHKIVDYVAGNRYDRLVNKREALVSKENEYNDVEEDAKLKLAPENQSFTTKFGGKVRETVGGFKAAHLAANMFLGMGKDECAAKHYLHCTTTSALEPLQSYYCAIELADALQAFHGESAILKDSILLDMHAAMLPDTPTTLSAAIIAIYQHATTVITDPVEAYLRLARVHKELNITRACEFTSSALSSARGTERQVRAKKKYELVCARCQCDDLVDGKLLADSEACEYSQGHCI